MFAAGICVRLAADIAGNVPVTLAAGILVKFAALAAGNVAGKRASAIVQVKFVAVKLVKFAPLIAGNVPVTLAAGILVKLAPDPLNVVPVIIPETTIPSTLVVIVPTPAVCVILLTLISDAIWVHFPPLF